MLTVGIYTKQGSKMRKIKLPNMNIWKIELLMKKVKKIPESILGLMTIQMIGGLLFLHKNKFLVNSWFSMLLGFLINLESRISCNKSY